MIKLFSCLDKSNENEETNRRKFESYKSDLVPNVYEGKLHIILYKNRKHRFVGGFKTWECSYDLVEYLKSIIDNFQDTSTVLEVSKMPTIERKTSFHQIFT